ncbi:MULTISPECIES: lytic transglycosylase domain-containing protein [Chitinophagaceae]
MHCFVKNNYLQTHSSEQYYLCSVMLLFSSIKNGKRIRKVGVFIIAGVLGVSWNATAQNDTSFKTAPSEFKNLLPNKTPVSNAGGQAIIHTGLNPQVVGFKDQYVKREKHEMTRMKDWGRPYFHIYDKVLSEYHLPLELKYLSVIESSLQSGMRSWAGAVGPWQLMYDEAMRFGLKVQDGIDERTDYQKSTIVAAKLLCELHRQFGDWLLVIAAYNAGPGAVRKAMRKSGSDDFWKLQYYLPLETRNHVKKFISTHYFFEGGGGITTMTKNETNDYQSEIQTTPVLTAQDTINTTTCELIGFYDWNIICQKLNMNAELFNKLNPGLNKVLANGKSYKLRLPTNKMDLFLQEKNSILEACFKQLMG